MGAFQWLMKKITKVFGRSTNALFYTLLYREILKEINYVTDNEEESVAIMREIGKRAAYESCERHSSIFKFMPGSPRKVIDYFEILWVVVFGKELAEGELTYEEVSKEGSKYNDYIITIETCPICAGYGSEEEDTFDFRKLKGKDTEGMACGLCGMLESVANYILKVKKNDYRIGIIEEKCMAKGEEHLQFICKIYDNKEWKERAVSKVQEQISSKIDFNDKMEDEFVQETKLDLIDKLQDVLSLDKIEELFDEPLESVKEKIAELIKDKMNLEPENFFDYFRNYEDDMIRIIGFITIHLFNEYGGLVEKFLESESFAKVAGYFFKQLKEITLLFIPLDVINDYHHLLISFLDGLAPTEMVDNVRKFSGKDDINFFFEGAQMALENLGIDFSELKENIWDELRKEHENDLIPAEPSMIDKSQEKLPKIIQIFQEILMLVNEILTLPIRVLISEGHYGLKTAINSVISEEEGLFGTMKTHADNIFDQIQELRK